MNDDDDDCDDLNVDTLLNAVLITLIVFCVCLFVLQGRRLHSIK